MTSATANGKAKVKPVHTHKPGESKEKYFARLSELPKTVFGKGGSDAWFHFDELYEDENAIANISND